DRKVALKFLRHDRVGTGRRERLLAEARTVAQLSHPNVIAIYDVATHEGEIFLAMEFVAGTTLEPWLRSATRERPPAVPAFAQAGRGLAAAHAANLVHRDFKPSNVLLSETNEVRVTDFGLGGASGTDSEAGGVSTVAGTPPYMAPEQLAGRAGDALSDQWSF